jgi:hypothetical protein
MYKYGEINDTFYFTFAVNDTNGSGTSGSVPSAKVRLVGAASDAAPVYSATPYLLTHGDYPTGSYEVAIPATTGNGFVDGNEYSVFNTLVVGTQNPTGNIGGFTLNPILTSSSSIDLSSQDSKNNISSGVIIAFNTVIDANAPSGSINYKMLNLATENDLVEQLLNTVVQSYNTANTVGRAFNQIVSGVVVDVSGVVAPTVTQIREEIDNNSTQLQTLTTRLSAARAGYLDNLSSGIVAQSSEVQTLLSRLTAVRAGYIDNLSAGAVALNSDMSTLLTRVSDTRASYLDNLSSGVVAQNSDIQELLARITTTRAGYIDLLNNGSYGLAQLVRSTTPENTLNVDTNGQVSANNLSGISGVINNIFNVAAKLDTAMELDGVVWKFTENALENSPVGASGTINFTATDRENLENVKTVTDILNTMVENVSGQRFTQKALEQTPSGTIDTSTLAKESTLNIVGNNIIGINNGIQTNSGLINTVNAKSDNIYNSTQLLNTKSDISSGTLFNIQSDIITVDNIVDNIYSSTLSNGIKLDSQSGVINNTGVKIQDVESGLSHIHAMQALFALTAKMNSPSSGIVDARNYIDSKNRIHWTVDNDSNRLTVTYDFD